RKQRVTPPLLLNLSKFTYWVLFSSLFHASIFTETMDSGPRDYRESIFERLPPNLRRGIDGAATLTVKGVLASVWFHHDDTREFIEGVLGFYDSDAFASSESESDDSVDQDSSSIASKTGSDSSEERETTTEDEEQSSTNEGVTLTAPADGQEKIRGQRMRNPAPSYSNTRGIEPPRPLPTTPDWKTKRSVAFVCPNCKRRQELQPLIVVQDDIVACAFYGKWPDWKVDIILKENAFEEPTGLCWLCRVGYGKKRRESADLFDSDLSMPPKRKKY
ncbi:uncharacterized protein BKA78DRAFT_367843, partial [Phyllosticta capitalensis]|uniref:uncharacterized protein n=1 Tax=Phyllosticta capitalensis TaxID=121624 RepID=UPI00312F00F0